MNKPIIGGLKVHTIEVDGDDPRQQIDDPKYADYNHNHVVRPGRRRVRYVLLPCLRLHNRSNHGVIEEIKRRNLTRPVGSTVEPILDARKAECSKKPIVGVCGKVRSAMNGESFVTVVGCILESAEGRDRGLYDLGEDWPSNCRFIAIVSDEEI